MHSWRNPRNHSWKKLKISLRESQEKSSKNPERNQLRNPIETPAEIWEKSIWDSRAKFLKLSLLKCKKNHQRNLQLNPRKNTWKSVRRVLGRNKWRYLGKNPLKNREENMRRITERISGGIPIENLRRTNDRIPRELNKAILGEFL